MPTTTVKPHLKGKKSTQGSLSKLPKKLRGELGLKVYEPETWYNRKIRTRLPPQFLPTRVRTSLRRHADEQTRSERLQYGRNAPRSSHLKHKGSVGGMKSLTDRTKIPGNTLKHHESSLSSENEAVTEEKNISMTGSSSYRKRDRVGSLSRTHTSTEFDVTSSHINMRSQGNLAEDDARIAALERKLGKKRRKTRDDGIQSLFGELDMLGEYKNSDEDGEHSDERENGSEIDEWLSGKRLKTSGGLNSGARKWVRRDSVSFESPEGSAGEVESSRRRRENPYVAWQPPVPVQSPPRSNGFTPEAASLHPLRRQVQGLLNKLSEANLLEIVRRIDEFYRENPRNDVSTVLIELLMTHLTGHGSLSDTFVILHSGFVAALYRIVGVEFGAQLVQTLVNCFDRAITGDGKITKEDKLNIVAFFADLYNFQVIGSKLIYDYIRQFVMNLSEFSVKLLLKIVRISGQQLRQDDPSSLKDIVVLLQNAVRQAGESNLSIQTRFMVETIVDLKNGRTKAGQNSAALRTEHTLAMKKTLASMSSTKGLKPRSIEPIRVDLSDLKNSELRGKWWLVGASFRNDAPTRLNPWYSDTILNVGSLEVSCLDESADEKEWEAPDVSTTAKSLGMNTELRRAIFTTIATATGVDDAYASLIKLRLNRRQAVEIAIVLTRCAAAQYQYNDFYHQLAQRLSINREFRKALWSPFTEIVTHLEDEQQDANAQATQYAWFRHAQARYNISRFYSFLIADGVVSLMVFKNRNLLSAEPQLSSFYELLLVNVFSLLGRSKRKISSCFGVLQGPEISSQMGLLLERVVMRSTFVEPKRAQVIRKGCQYAIDVITSQSA